MNKIKIIKVLIEMPLIVSFLILFSISTASAFQGTKTYGGSNNDVAYSIQLTSDAGYVVAGVTGSFGDVVPLPDADAWVLKLDGNGIVQWQNIYTGILSYDHAYSVQPTSDGGYVVTGSTYIFDANSSSTKASDAWVLKLDGNGVVQWQKTYGGPDNDYAYSIQQTSDAGYIVAGETWSFSAGINNDGWVLKLDGNGVVQWQMTYGGTNYDYAYSIQQTSDGGYIVAGQTASFGAGYDDVWVLKLDGNGVVQWQKTYGGPDNDYAYSIQQTSDAGYIVAGETFSFGAGMYDVWVLKLDGNGIVQWQMTYGGTNYDYAYSIQQTSDGGYIVAGQTFSFGAGMYDVWVLKLDGNGNINNCSIVKTSNSQDSDTNADVQDTNVTGADSGISPETSIVSVLGTNAVVQEKCTYGCTVVPDTPSIRRGGSLGLQATGTNNTSDTNSLLFATNVRLPNGNMYPSSDYLFGPFSFSLGPYQSKSKHLWQVIPSNAPLGTYTYYGYLGNYGNGLYGQCSFTFDVIP